MTRASTRPKYYKNADGRSTKYVPGSAEHRELVKQGLVPPPQGKKLRSDGKAFIPVTRQPKKFKTVAEHVQAVKNGTAEPPPGKTLSKSGKTFVKAKSSVPEGQYKNEIEAKLKTGLKEFQESVKDFSTVQFRARLLSTTDDSNTVAYGKKFHLIQDPVDIVLPVKDAKKIQDLLAIGNITSDVISEDDFVDKMLKLPADSGASELYELILKKLEYDETDWSNFLVIFDNIAYSHNLTAEPESDPGDWTLSRSAVCRGIGGSKFQYTILESDNFLGMFPVNPLDPKVDAVDGDCLIEYFCAKYKYCYQKYGKRNSNILDLSGDDAVKKVREFLGIPEGGVTLNQMVPLFDLYRLGGVFAYGRAPEYKTLWQYGSRGVTNKNITPSVLHVQISNNHVYPLNESQIHLDSCHDKDISLTVSKHYRLPKPKEEEEGLILSEEEKKTKKAEKGTYPTTLVHSVDDIPRHVWSTKGRECNVFKFYTKIPLFEFSQDVTRNGYVPIITSTDTVRVGRLTLDNLKRSEQDPIYITIEREPLAPGKIPKPVAVSDDQLQVFHDVKEEYHRKILSYRYRSTYSDGLRILLNENKLGGTKGSFVSEREFNQYEIFKEIDVSKAYTYQAIHCTHVPVFGYFDVPLPYDGHELEHYTLYSVTFKTTENYVYRENHLGYGFALKKFQDQIKTVHYFIRPCRVEKCNFAEDLQQVYENEALTEAGKKAIANITTGLLGKSQNKKSTTQIYLSRDEAFTYRLTKRILHFESDGMHFWTVSDRVRQDLEDGFTPIYQLLLESHTLMMWELRQKMISAGVPPIYQVTDAFLVAPDADLTKLKLDWKDPTLSTFQNIGRLGVSTKSPPSWKPPQSYRQPVIIHFQPPTPPTIRNPTNEWDDEEIYQILDTQQNWYIHAPPGCGKTYGAIEYVKSRNLKTLCVTAWNSTEKNLNWPTEHKTTASSLFNRDNRGQRMKCLITPAQKIVRGTFGKDSAGKSVDGGSEGFTPRVHSRSCRSDTPYSCILFDEVTVSNVQVREDLKRLMQEMPSLRVIVTGDANQLQPIETLPLNNINGKQYYAQILDKMFPNQVTLKEPKRCRCKKHRSTYTLEQIRDCVDCASEREFQKNTRQSITGANTVHDAVHYVKTHFKQTAVIDGNKRNVSYTNPTCEAVNKKHHAKMMRQLGLPLKTRYYVGQLLISRSTTRTKNFKLFTNCVYKVVEIGKEQIHVEDQSDGSSQYVPRHVLDRCNDYFCQTVHSVQGASISEPYTIFDINNKHVTREWLLVAVTRNIDQSAVSWYNGSFDSTRFPSDEEIQKRIDTHKEQDKNAGRNWARGTYMTVDEVKYLLKTTDRCMCCGGGIPNDFSKISINRIDNCLAHIKGNVNILCSSRCNSSLK